MLEICKRVFAISIFICLFLPLCQCTQRADIAGNPTTPVAETASNYGPDVIIIAEQFEFRSPAGWLESVPAFGAFCWPLLACLVRAQLHRRAHIAAINLSEIACCAAGLGCFAQLLRFWSEWRYGGIILCAGYLGHILASGLCIAAQVRRPIRPAAH
ncbi:hypothetical protein [Uliginosibacterium gangwonense]|uniref:hypothetical protein n=1 Tax=Uliginosibacterium gangwonense TaxID=392736 RepID=UPI0003682127|nr:hypothetical protein [Uliginosibacterium gangwonense]